jgi:hypothetical protein
MSDDRKMFSAGFFGNNNWGGERYFHKGSYTLMMTIRPLNTLSITLLPSYSVNNHELQYVTRQELNGDSRYIFGTIDQKVLSMSLRINYNITPDLTIQYWGQPFTASGDYSEFKMITDSKAGQFADRYHIYTTDQIELVDGTYRVDENMDSNIDYTFGNPDFTVDEWLSNLVVRWEFMPGSTAYLVWSQTRNSWLPNGDFELWDSLDNMFTEQKATNIFLVKFSYRFGLR